MKILLIEDDLDAAQVTCELLRSALSATVTTVTRGQQALRLLEGIGAAASHFDLIVLDLGLPDVDGVELCRHLRIDTHLRAVPVVVVSGYTDEQHLEAALDAGANDYLCKPVRGRELIARVRAALRELYDRQRQFEATVRLADVASELRRNNEALERLSTVDPLTQLANRHHFNMVFLREWRRASRSGGSLATVMVDIDHFHDFNETYGHLAGDRCLQQVAGALASVGQRPCDEVARWGGEEFVYVLPDAESDGARLVAERARAAVAHLAIPHDTSPAAAYVTVSVGTAAMRPRPDLSPEALLGAADDAMFQAKRHGRNCVCDAFAARRSMVVEVDPLIAPRIPRFLGNRREDARALLEAARQGALDVAFRIGHNLRGIGSSYGFDPISELGGRIEQATHRHDLDGLRRAAQELADYLDQVQVVPRGAGGLPVADSERLVSGSHPR